MQSIKWVGCIYAIEERKTMSELTQTDGTFQNVAMNGDEKDWDVGASRWTKGGNDRLYFNDSKFVDYVDLQSLRVVGSGSAVRGSAEIDGDTLTVSVSVRGDKEMEAVFELPDELAETPTPRSLDEDVTVVMSERDTAELVTDGGQDASPDVTDEEIEQAIDQHDDPDHPEAATVADVREALATINADMIAHWDLYQDAIDEDAHEIVHEDSGVIVLADHTGHLWTEQLDAAGIEDDRLRSIIKSLHHTAARSHCDYSWSVVDPAVVRKPEAFRSGEAHVLREIARRTDETGSVARAVDQLATEVHGWAKGSWATMTGRNASTVTRTTRPKESGE
jgi:hypothetical protein